MYKRDLTPRMRELVERMQDINFGRIANITIRDGEPEINSTTLIEREIKLTGQNGPRQERTKDDFCLKEEVVLLCSQLRQIGDGVIQSLEIKNGLPFLIRVLEPAI